MQLIERMFDEQPDFPSEDFEGNLLPSDDEIEYFVKREFEHD